MSYDTGNPLGSTDPRDFSDNSENLDRAVNNAASATWTDRFGKSRTTLAGQIGYIGTGSGGAIESYSAGLVLSTYSTIILYNNEFYRPSASATLPYTTTATTPDVDSNLVSVGDAVLRQDLAGNLSDGEGAALVKGATIYVGSVAELEALSLPVGTAVYLTEEVRAGSGIVKSGTHAADPQKGVFIDLSNGNYWERDSEFVNSKMFGAAGDGVADDTVSVEAAWNSGRTVYEAPGTYCFTKIELLSNLLVCANKDATYKQIQPSAASSDNGFYKASGAGSLDTINFFRVNFDGDRIENPTELFTAIFDIELGESETATNIRWVECDFKNAQEDFCRVTAQDNTARADDIYAIQCSYKTESSKLNLAGNSVISSTNGLRFWLRTDPKTNYGQKVFVNVGTINCTGENIRTLSDFKRGCYNFKILNNTTKNVHDVHHSVDGSFSGVVQGNVGVNEASFSLGNRPNMIEVQGEEIDVFGNVFDGGGVTTSFVLVSDYGEPEEDGAGHVSKNVNVADNIGKNCTSNIFKGINPHFCDWINNTAVNGGAHPLTIDSGTGRTESDLTTPLEAEVNEVDKNKGINCALGFNIRGNNHKYGSNTNQLGQEDLYFGGETTLRLSSVWANFSQITRVENFNPDLNMEVVGGALKYFSTPEAPAATADAPPGLFFGATLQDTSTGATRECALNTFIPATNGQIFYPSVWVKSGTASACAVLVQEYDAGQGFLNSTYKALTTIPSNWTQYITRHTVSDPLTAFIKVSLVPAASFNNPTATGTTNFSGLVVSKTPVGLSS